MYHHDDARMCDEYDVMIRGDGAGGGREEEGRRKGGGREEDSRVAAKKQEPHTEMWGIRKQ